MNIEQYIAEAGGLVQKWQETLLSEDAPKIKDTYRLAETAKMLEQQSLSNRNWAQQSGMMIAEEGSTNVVANQATWDPVLVSMVRRAAPVLMAWDFANVQTMNMPTGLVFCMRAHYGDKGDEALFGEPKTRWTGAPLTPVDADGAGPGTDTVFPDEVKDPFSSLYGVGRGMATAAAEGDISPEMSMTIDRISVTAKERVLKGSYTIELQQDMRAVHGLDAEGELANIMSNEMLGEINREFVRTLYIVAKLGAENTGTPGTYDLNSDADGRWSVEKFKGLVYQIALEANKIGFDIKRGLGNKILASPDVVTTLYMAGVLDTGGRTNLNSEAGAMDFTKSTYVGKLLGLYDLHVDPYTVATNAVIVGYRGSIPWDAGIYYCPYVPLQMFRATDPRSFQPRIAYKTRYGLVANPFVTKADGSRDAESMTPARNQYFRKFKVAGIG